MRSKSHNVQHNDIFITEKLSGTPDPSPKTPPGELLEYVGNYEQLPLLPRSNVIRGTFEVFLVTLDIFKEVLKIF